MVLAAVRPQEADECVKTGCGDREVEGRIQQQHEQIKGRDRETYQKTGISKMIG